MANANPVVTITAPAAGHADAGPAVTLPATFTDAGTNDTHTCSIDWGDGTTTTGTVTESNGSGTCTGTHTYSAGGSHTIKVTVTDDDGGVGTAQVVLTLTTTTCPPSGNVNVRWHYSANGTSGSWSGTTSTSCADGSVTMGPQSMEGDLKLSPGTTLKTGYDFTLPGNNASYTATVLNPSVTFIVHCASGASPSAPTFTVPMPTQTYPVSRDAWAPSGDQSSSLVYQGSARRPRSVRRRSGEARPRRDVLGGRAVHVARSREGPERRPLPRLTSGCTRARSRPRAGSAGRPWP